LQPSDNLLNNEDTREFKVRIVEKLTLLEHRLNNPIGDQNKKEDGETVKEQEYEGTLNEEFETLKSLENEVLETMNREFISRVLLKTLDRM